ncbi:MAG: hypothetical protein QFX34_04460 [Candidatus Verstraetearchaeota archaeon]|nr:hypothetical protein [Candidatus Verstraetearchaeota archaeon]
MRLSTGINLLNVLIVLSIVTASTVSILLAINAFGVVSSVRVGEPSVFSSGSVVEVSIPVQISNNGPFGVSGVRVSGELRDASGVIIASLSSPPFSVAAGEKGAHRIMQVRIDFSAIPQERLYTLFSQAGNITLLAKAGASLEPFISISAQASGAVPWVPPIQDFELGSPQLLGYNSTHISASLPVRFRNPSEISVEGSVNALFLDTETGSVIGSGYLEVNAPSNSVFEGTLLSTFSLPENATALLLEARTYRCNATFGFMVFGNQVYSISRPFELHWAPPVGSPYFGSPSVVPHNSTHSMLYLPFGFTNTNELVTLNGSARLGMVVGGSLVSESTPVGISVPPGSAHSCNFALMVPNWALSAPGTIILSMDTQFGSASVEVPING